MSEYDQILRLLDDEDGEIRAAATLVLGLLRPVRPELIERLRRRLGEAPAAERSYLVDALAATEDPAVLGDLLPFAEEPGSAAEQVVRILRRFDRAGLEAIEHRHGDEPGWRSGAYVKAVAGIHHVESIDMLMRRLEGATWDQARATSICVIENFDAFPREAQRRLAELVRARLGDESADRDGFAVTTCLRLAQHLPLDVPLESVLAFTRPERIGAVRRHAIQSLGGFVLDDDELERARAALHEALFDEAFDAVVKPALEVLESWSDRPAPAGALRGLLDSPHPFAVRHALDGLRERLRRGALPPTPEERAAFESRLDAAFPQVRRAAMLGLVAFPEGPPRVVERMRTETNRFLARELGEALADGLESPEAPLARTLLERFLAGEEDRNEDAFVEFLVRLDRDHFNRALAEWARARLADGEAESVIRRVQPVVRLRHSDEENRFLLAVANLTCAGARDREDPCYRRCIDILSPLARTWGYSVADRVAEGGELDDGARLAIAEGLGLKGPVERAAARRILDGLPAALPALLAERRATLHDKLRTLDPESETG